jgi:hypothetical protein
MAAGGTGLPWERGPQRSLEEIIRAKRPAPLASVDELMAPGVFPSDDEVDEFVRAYRADRNAELR